MSKQGNYPGDLKRPSPAYIRCSRSLAESKTFAVVTSLLTIFALTGDDARLIGTEKPMDPIFDGIVILCIFTFSVELIACCLGKADYLWSFFFWLDLISTITLVLDITTVAEWVMQMGGEDDESGKDMRSGRTARMGARASRIVRVLRLMRILKLYKFMVEAGRTFEQKVRRTSRAMDESMSLSEADFAEEIADQNQGEGLESQVGRRLSEVTIRQTICLILAMMLVLPHLSAEVSNQTASSPDYGADFVAQTFEDARAAPSTEPGSRLLYNKALLQFIYYHNWFARAVPSRFCTTSETCPADYFGHLFWVGVEGTDPEVVERIAAEAQLDEALVNSFETTYRSDGIYNLGTMPDEAKFLLSSPWLVDCDSAKFPRRGISLLAEEIDDVVDYVARCPKDLRPAETIGFIPRLITESQFQDWHLVFYFDVRPFVRTESAFRLLEIFTICVLLLGSSVLFTHDARRLVINPVEKMLKRVQEIRNNPITAMNMALREVKVEEEELDRRKRSCLKLMCNKMCKTSAEPLETVMLEKSIIKLGSLLALGFGEAGATIISQNMQGDGGSLNAMVPGRRVESVIGVVRIQHFTTFIEVLQSKIMTFVNQIAEIVHGVVTEYQGAPNKNNGDTFLVIWRFDEDFVYEEAQRLVELSVLSFCKIFAAVQSSPTLAGYRAHPGLQYRLNRLGSDARVHLSFGLHFGWAIEGTVGTEYKIDASYLSPNVSIANSMEEATRYYGVPLVASRTIVERCTRAMIDKFRLIDNVDLRGSTRAMKLYSMDLDYRSVPVDKSPPLDFVWNQRRRLRARQFLDRQKRDKFGNFFSAVEEFEEDPIIWMMRKRYTTRFMKTYDMGYQNYSQGEWEVARRILSGAKSLLGVEDGPSNALLRFMQASNFQAPKSWTAKPSHSLAAVRISGGEGPPPAAAALASKTW